MQFDVMKGKVQLMLYLA